MFLIAIRFLIFILSANFCIAESAVDTLEVFLPTENSLSPIYIAKWQETQGEISPAYLLSLEKIFLYDFNNNGITSALEQNSEREKMAGNTNFSQTLPFWEKQKVYCLITANLKGSSLELKVVDVALKKIMDSPQIALSGNLNEDRKKIHLASDTILKAIFQQEGIASTKILYTLRVSDISANKWLSDIWECDYDGANARAVVQNKGYCVTPFYLPPSKGCSASNIGYVSYETGQPKIYLCSLFDAKNFPLIALRGNQLMACINRSRTQIAFISDVTGNPDLFLLDFDIKKGAVGKPKQIFRAKFATQGSPCFSSDGKKLAFVSDKDGSPRIYILDVASACSENNKKTEASLITKLNRECTSPAFSPDGKFLAYSSMTQGTRQLWLYDLNTKNEKQLTFGEGHKENPSWAPNSLHIVYNVCCGNLSDLYYLNIAQLTPQKIKLSGNEKRFPFWEVR